MPGRHRHKHRHHHKRLSGVKLVSLVIGIVLVYFGILYAVNTVGNRIEHSDVKEAVGSLEGRFDAQKITYFYDGRYWEYRGRDLTNILLIGTDWDDDRGAKSSRYAGQADFLLLLTLDRRYKTISTMQIDRDTMTDIRIYGPFGDYTGIRKNQICLSYAYGSNPKSCRENVSWAVRHLFGGISIDGVITLDMSGISALNDALGGVTVTLEDDFSKLDPQMTVGTTLTLHGDQAEYFVRGRMNVGDGTNVGRMRRQRAFLQEAEKLLVQGVNEDIDFVSELLDALSDHMTLSMDRSWLIDKAYECRAYSRQGITLLEGTHCIGADGFVEFHPDTDSIDSYVTTHFFE